MSSNDRDDYVRQIRAVGESLIKNAESIVGSERYLVGISLAVTIDPDASAPNINVSRDFCPERYFENEAKDD